MMWKGVLDFKSDASLNGYFMFVVRWLQHDELKTSGQ